MSQTQALFDYPKYWAECYGTAPFLPMSRAEMDVLGWDSCDIIIVTGDAYVGSTLRAAVTDENHIYFMQSTFLVFTNFFNCSCHTSNARCY